MASGQVPSVAGSVLPGGEYRIASEENRLLCESLHTEPAADGSAHAIYAYIATQAGMGLSVDGLLAMCEFDAADGPMLGSSNSRYLAPLMTDETYRVTGKILSLTRKTSRKLGVIDVLEYRLAMSRRSGERVLEVTNTWILPRRHLHA
jgi:acyl dehydratase